jgi:cobalt-zinc-cadmium efflux system protein
MEKILNNRIKAKKRIIYVLLITISIFIIEIIGSIISRSVALLSDSFHVLTDLLALTLTFIALIFSSKPATSKKSYGYYRLEVLAAFINGLILIFISFYIFYEGYRRILNPVTIRSSYMISVAFIGLIGNIIGMLILSKSKGENLNIYSSFLHLFGDTLSSIGVILGGFAIAFTGIFIIDPIISIVIGIIIIISALRLSREAFDILLESTPKEIDSRMVGKAIKEIDGVDRIHDLHIWSLSSGIHTLSTHITVGNNRLLHIDNILADIKNMLKERFNIDHVTIQIESENYKEEEPIH